MVARNRNAISPDPGKAGSRTGIVAAGALLCLAAPHTLFAASSLGSGCDSIASVARELQSVEIPFETLTVDIVDHMAEDHGAIDPVIGHEQDPTAPLLFLTPRVAHILQDVFGDTDAAEPEATPMERVRRIMLAASAAAKAPSPQPASEAATAGGGDGDVAAGVEMDPADPGVSSGPLADTFYDADTLPPFQRRMYRNDI